MNHYDPHRKMYIQVKDKTKLNAFLAKLQEKEVNVMDSLKKSPIEFVRTSR